MPDSSSPPLLLDTHVWIWIIEGTESELAVAAIEEVNRASARGAVLISAISVWEVAMLEAKGRLSLSRPMKEWKDLALGAPGTRLLELSPDIAVESTRLPGSPHGDPADRILIASARTIDATLVTRDENILAYGADGHVTVLDARP